MFAPSLLDFALDFRFLDTTLEFKQTCTFNFEESILNHDSGASSLGWGNFHVGCLQQRQ